MFGFSELQQKREKSVQVEKLNQIKGVFQKNVSAVMMLAAIAIIVNVSTQKKDSNSNLGVLFPIPLFFEFFQIL